MAENDFFIHDGVLTMYNGSGGKVVIPEGVTRIGEHAFSCCGELTAADIPETVTEIGGGAFCRCDNLTEVSGMAGVRIIAEDAFVRCPGLKRISLPAALEELDIYSFIGCGALERVDISKDCRRYRSVDGVVFSKDMRVLIYYPEGRKDKVYTLPEGVREIGGSAFFGCSNISRVIFPPGLERIGKEAFSECGRLKEVTVTESIREIGGFAFSSCFSLTRVTFENGVETIGDGAFTYCENLIRADLPPSVRVIGEGAFSGCASLKYLSLSEGVTEIGGIAFSDCESLEEANIPASVTQINSYLSWKSSYMGAFSGCTSLRRLEMNADMRVVEKRFKNADLFAVSGSDLSDVSELYPIECIEYIYIPGVKLPEMNPQQRIIYCLYYLTCPSRHSEEERKMYSACVKKNREKIFEIIVCGNIISAAAGFLSEKIVTVSEIDSYIAAAGELRQTQILAMLMEYKNSNFSFEDMRKEELRRIRKELYSDPFSVTQMKKLWRYEILGDGRVKLTAYKGSEENITVPERIGKRTVSAIGGETFSTEQKRIKNRMTRKFLRSVTVPDSVNQIEKGAFNGCEAPVICGSENSCAHKFAQENGISFSAVT